MEKDRKKWEKMGKKVFNINIKNVVAGSFTGKAIYSDNPLSRLLRRSFL